MTINRKSNKIAFILRKPESDKTDQSCRYARERATLPFGSLTDEQFIKAVLFNYYKSYPSETDVWMQAITQRISWLSQSLQSVMQDNANLLKMLKE